MAPARTQEGKEPDYGFGQQQRLKNGPPLAGHGAEAVRDEIARVISALPEQVRRSLTWDQGAEMAQYAQLRVDTGLAIYFCDPHSPWQRGTNENAAADPAARAGWSRRGHRRRRSLSALRAPGRLTPPITGPRSLQACSLSA